MMRRRAIPFVALAALLAALAPPRAARGDDDVIERRGGAAPLTGRVQAMDDGGVRIATPGGAELTVSWDRVRRVEAAAPWQGFERHRPMAEDLWRARSRLERGDASAAEPLFERWFPQLAGRTHETALVAAEGLLRCRVARGDQAGAVLPALETLRMRRAGVVTAGDGRLPPVIDAANELCTAVPPFFARRRAASRLARDLASYDAQGDAHVAALARLYRIAAQRDAGELAASPDLPDDGDEARAILADLLRCTLAPADQRRAAAARCAGRAAAEPTPEWLVAWCTFARGAALLRDDGAAARRRGQAALVALAIERGRTQPFLAGLALAWSAESLAADGDAAGAEALRAALERRHPGHPVLRAIDPVGAPIAALVAALPISPEPNP